MDVLVCIKRVPGTGSSVTLTEDERAIDTRHLGFTIGPHEECAVEEALRLTAAHGGSVTVLTVALEGDDDADEQLRYAVSMGAQRAVRVAVQGVDELDPQSTSAAIVTAVRELGRFDLVLFGNESADAGHYQVGVRVAYALGLPIVAAVKKIEVSDGRVRLHRHTPDGVEVYESGLPAAAAVKEGLNLPRYPSMPGRLRARRATIELVSASVRPGGLRAGKLRVPEAAGTEAVVLGKGPEAAPAVVDLLEEMS